MQKDLYRFYIDIAGRKRADTDWSREMWKAGEALRATEWNDLGQPPAVY